MLAQATQAHKHRQSQAEARDSCRKRWFIWDDSSLHSFHQFSALWHYHTGLDPKVWTNNMPRMSYIYSVPLLESTSSSTVMSTFYSLHRHMQFRNPKFSLAFGHRDLPEHFGDAFLPRPRCFATTPPTLPHRYECILSKAQWLSHSGVGTLGNKWRETSADPDTLKAHRETTEGGQAKSDIRRAGRHHQQRGGRLLRKNWELQQLTAGVIIWPNPHDSILEHPIGITSV